MSRRQNIFKFWLHESSYLLPSLVAAVCTANILGIGCGTWAGNPKEPDPSPTSGTENSKVTIEFQGLVNETNLVAPPLVVRSGDGSVAGTIALSEARLCLKEIKIKTHGGDSGQRQKFTGPYIVDLLSNQITPAIGEISLESGVYRSIELRLAKLEHDEIGAAVDQGDAMIERSIVLNGIYTPSTGNAKAVSMTMALDEEFSLKLAGSRSGVKVDKDQINALIIGFGLYRWFDFSGSSLDFGDVDSDTIDLGAESLSPVAESLSERIKENIKESAEFAKDKDKDGKISEKDDEEDEIRRSEESPD